ncbi:uncharacterized protein BDFB_000346, partial [Asbolus verrucosus]
IPLAEPRHSVQPEGPLLAKPKQNFQQFQIVVLPPGAPHPPQPSQPSQESQPPSPAPPGFVWVQLPDSYFPSQTPPPQGNLPTQQPAIVQPPRPANPPNLPSPPPHPEVDDLSKKCQRPRGQFASDICNKYVNCWDGVAIEQFCPEGLVFNEKGYCDYAENVDCKGRPVHVDPNLRKKCLKPRGQFRSEACNKYVNCWDDVVIEQECPEGLLFSAKGYCDYPANVDCQNASPPPRTGNVVSSECPLDFGTFREKSNCSNYYTCIGGKIVAQYTCPAGFSFNDNIGVCDYAERVDCSKEPLIFNPKSNFLSNVPEDFMKKIDECQPGSVFPLNPQCTVACLCRDGLSEIVQCPAGLAYDAATDKCALPNVAK